MDEGGFGRAIMCAFCVHMINVRIAHTHIMLAECMHHKMAEATVTSPRLPKNLYEQLAALADEKMISAAAALRQAVELYLQTDGGTNLVRSGEVQKLVVEILRAEGVLKDGHNKG